MDATEYRFDNMVILELHGRIDELNAAILSEEVETIWRTGKKHLVVDLSRATFMSARCLRALWRAHDKLRHAGGAIYLCGAKGLVAETIAFVRIDCVLHCFANLDEISDFVKNKPAEKSNPPSDSGSSELDGGGGFIPKFLQKILKRSAIVIFALVVSKQEARAEKEIFTLEEVLNIARESNGQLTLARLRMSERQADVDITKAVGRPQFMATGGYLYQSNPNVLGDILNRELNGVRNSGQDPTAEQLKTRSNIKLDKDITLLSLGAWQLFYVGGLQRHQTALKQAQKAEAEAALTSESMSIEEQIRNAFIALLLVQEKLNFLGAQKAAFDERMKAVLKAKEAKVLSELQTAEAEALVLKVTSEMIAARREERTLRSLMNIGLGRPMDAAFKPAPTSLQDVPELGEVEHYVDIAIHRSSEMKRSLALIDSANAYQKIVNAQATFSPIAGVFGSVDYMRGATSTQDATNWTVGVGVMVPIYDGGKSSAEFEKARILSTQAKIAFDESEKKLRADIVDIIAHIEQSKAQLNLARKTFEIATRRVGDAKQAVAEEVVPQFRAAEAIASQIEAKLTVIASQAELFRWHAKLESFIGKSIL